MRYSETFLPRKSGTPRACKMISSPLAPSQYSAKRAEVSQRSGTRRATRINPGKSVSKKVSTGSTRRVILNLVSAS